MSRADTILTQIQTQLNADVTLKAYVKNVFLGVREDITNFPCIILEPLALKETEERYGIQTLRLTVALMGYIKVFNKDIQIVGDSNNKGIMDLENDVKYALDTDRTLSGNAIHTRILDTAYEFENYPERNFTMVIEILFEQQKSVRT